MSWVVVACGSATVQPESAATGSTATDSSSAVMAEHDGLANDDAANEDAQARKASPTSQGQALESSLLAVMPPPCADGKSCEPPVAFARAVCKGKYPGLALAMFEKGSPWQRLYLETASLEPVNAYGARQQSKPLEYGEEVLLLRSPQASDTGGMQVSGASDVDLLRWDGTCITARREFFAEYMMPEVRNAEINVKYLDEEIKAALLEQKYVQITYERQREACKGSRTSEPTPQCASATKKLNDAITVAVRGGMKVPSPEKIPAWASERQAYPDGQRVSSADVAGR